MTRPLITASVLLLLSGTAWAQTPDIPQHAPPPKPGAHCIVGPTGMAMTCTDPIPEVPDDAKTPGVIADDGHDAAEVCAIVDGLSYSKRHRDTPLGLKAFIRKRDHSVGTGEVDHRVPLALGGADVVFNLFWQPGPDAPGVTWNYHDKDALETFAWEGVCRRHDLPLAQAQAMFIAPADWRRSYCQVFTDPRCGQQGATWMPTRQP